MKLPQSLRLALGALSLLAVAAPARAQSLIQLLTVGTNPARVAVNPVTGTVYVGNNAGATGNTISVISGATHAVSTLTGLTGQPVDIAVNPVTNKIYAVINSGSGAGRLAVILGSTNTLIATVPVGNGPVALAIDPVLNRIFVVNQSNTAVTVINGADDSVVTNLNLVGAVGLRAITVNPVTHYVYVGAGATGSPGTLEVINGQTAGYTRRLTFGISHIPAAIAVNPVTNKIYAMDSSDTIEVANGETASTAATLGAAVSLTGNTLSALAVNPVNNRVYVASGNNHSLAVINGATGATPASFSVYVPLSGAATPGAVAVDASANRVIVGDPAAGRVYVLNGATNAFIYNTPLLQATGAIGVNPLTGRFYVALPATAGLAAFDVRDNALTTSATIAGGSAQAVTANPASGKSYFANTGSNSITVVSPGVANKDVPLGGVPVVPGNTLAHNPVTNRIYALLDNGAAAGSLKVIDGASDTVVATVPVGIGPQALAVNPANNFIYVANYLSQSVTVIDGSANTVMTTLPWPDFSVGVKGVAVNPATNRIYVLSGGGLRVIDGASNIVTLVLAAASCKGLAVNRVTNKVYIARSSVSAITVVDGATLAVSTIPTPNPGQLIAVNEATDKIYMSGYTSPDHLQIASGAGSGALLATLTIGNSIGDIAVNANSNVIYLPDGDNNLLLVDGITDSLRLTLDTSPYPPVAVAVNPVAGQLVIARGSGLNNILVLTEKPVMNIPLDVTISPLAGNTTTTSTPFFTFGATSSYSPTAPPPQQVHYQVDGWQGEWLPTPYFFGSWNATLAPLSYGTHTLYAWADDGQAATSINPASSPVTGQIAAYTFRVAPDGPVITGQPASQTVCAQAVASFTVTATGSGTLTYGWKHGTTWLAEGGNISGSSTKTLTLNPVDPADVGTYTAYVYNNVSGYRVQDQSSAATLTVDSLHTPPSDALNLRIVKGPPDQLTWSPPSITGGYPVTYDVLRSGMPDNFTNTLFATCIAANISSVNAADSYGFPAYYLIRARNSCGSTLGANSSGAPVQGRSCP